MHELTETIFASPARVDADAGIIYGVKLLGAVSRNKRRYAKTALESAKTAFEGRGMTLNHDRKRGGDRGVEEDVAFAKDVEVREDGAYGDIHIYKSHAHGPLLLERAQKAPNSFGVSQHAHCEATEGDDGWLDVSKVLECVSLDFVKDPATTKGLFESDETKGETLREAIYRQAPEDKAYGILETLIGGGFQADARMARKETSLEKSIELASRDLVPPFLMQTQGMELVTTLYESIQKVKSITENKPLLKEEPKMSEPAIDPKVIDTKFEALTESIKAISASVEGLTTIVAEDRNRLAISEEMQRRGLTVQDLTDSQQKLLSEQTDHKKAAALLDSWPNATISAKARQHNSTGFLPTELTEDAEKDAFDSKRCRLELIGS